MHNNLITDPNRGKELAGYLLETFQTQGIHGRNDMPEDVLPKMMNRGSLEHLLFTTLTVSIDYQRDAERLWESSRMTFMDPDTRYLFNPSDLQDTPMDKIIRDMQKYGLSKKPSRDAKIWSTISNAFHKKWQGDPRNFLEDCNWDALTILRRLKSDTHYNMYAISPDFINLRGDKIGPLWIRMLRDNVGISRLQNLDRIPIPVDIHIARASLSLGVVKGKGNWTIKNLFEEIRKTWFESVLGLKFNSRSMIALDVDEPLWHLSRYGCTKRDKETGQCPVYNSCEARDYCIKGKIKIDLGSNMVELNT
jgi:hypothetical protein